MKGFVGFCTKSSECSENVLKSIDFETEQNIPLSWFSGDPELIGLNGVDIYSILGKSNFASFSSFQGTIPSFKIN